ncbi:DUF4239 domain-containing protein [Nocardia huaxiensis]|uniref:DUF4239 domain-containing protein n=1 Tax=Nocardia huaxiensis TaxID=2755382 RepID=A0A7D6ZLJ5_9NOCA|nr:DUF4239 domain-containing protein [Nocardia huaxiensis]QLY33527.1 DUF4239 domain-containing protein [Nocardia huaxiensis]
MALQIIVPVLFAVVALLIFVVGDRLRPKTWRHADDEAAGTMVTDLVNMFFAAIVAFAVVICWQQYDNATAHTVAESKGLLTVYSAANDLPDKDRREIQGLVEDYTHEVLTDEWSEMAKHRRLSETTQTTFDDLSDAVGAVESTEPAVQDALEQAGAGLDAISEARYDRGLDAEYRMPAYLYVALWFGTGMLLLGTVLSGVGVTKRSLLMTGLFGLVVGGVVLAVYNLDGPFTGGNVVSKSAYELALSQFEHLAATAPAQTILPR